MENCVYFNSFPSIICQPYLNTTIVHFKAFKFHYILCFKFLSIVITLFFPATRARSRGSTSSAAGRRFAPPRRRQAQLCQSPSRLGWGQALPGRQLVLSQHLIENQTRLVSYRLPSFRLTTILSVS